MEVHTLEVFIFIFYIFFRFSRSGEHGDFIICLFAYLFIYLCAPNFYRHRRTVVVHFSFSFLRQ